MSIQVKALSKRIDNREILRGITFTWQPGRIVGLVGRNGVGKTTLFRTMADHYLADEGELVIEGAVDFAATILSAKIILY
ncbi:ATP-binding cassette domain-containing protein [Lactiplantibacillus plantarum]|uniref:ATP-binding cassette domain-containing protein n=1 Tax=Lactiplantibacillus plantarum TaxID=1590 RepID=UPI00165280F9|nr:ATP-binding cassette domain-containing protein [Lactiplantibacillus plantarum]